MKLFLALLLLFPSQLVAKTIKIAIVDSGLTRVEGVKLCKDGLVDFTGTNTKSEFHGHGDNTTHIIADGLGNRDYCIYHLKAFSFNSNNQKNSLKAFKYAIIDKKVDIINYSGGGPDSSKDEKEIISLAVKNGIIFVTAAGNERVDLDENCNYYPACYKLKNVVIVGNLNSRTSNYGDIITMWKDGNDINAGGVVLTGTSQSTALATRDIALKLLKDNK